MTPEPLQGRLATCSYRAFRPEMGHAVRITRGAPRYKLGYELAGSASPTWPRRGSSQISSGRWLRPPPPGGR
jgi:hypothetical protein